MKKYKIEITETSSKIIEIKANSEEEAIEKVALKYKNEEIVLNESDFVDVGFKVYKS